MLRLLEYLIKYMPETRKITAELNPECVSSILNIPDASLINSLWYLTPNMTNEIFPNLVEARIRKRPFTYYELESLADL